MDIEDFEEKGVNMTILNTLKADILQVNYYCFVEIDEITTSDKIPQLLSWSIKNFTSHLLILDMKFSNPLYVSSSTTKDQVDIKVLNSNFFVAKVDLEQLLPNYTLNNFTVPSQARSQEEFETMSSIGAQAENSMMFTLIVPFCFMVFMSVSMNRVWSLYLML